MPISKSPKLLHFAVSNKCHFSPSFRQAIKGLISLLIECLVMVLVMFYVIQVSVDVIVSGIERKLPVNTSRVPPVTTQLSAIDIQLIFKYKRSQLYRRHTKVRTSRGLYLNKDITIMISRKTKLRKIY